MAIEPLMRTSYIDPNSNFVRIGETTHGESLVDQTKYQQPLERAHGAGMHVWGIGQGLAITGTLNQPSLHVLAGIAADAAGRHIVLGQGGKAEIGPNADNLGVAPNLVDVNADNAASPGAVMPTTGLTGAFYVTLTWRESFDADLWNSSSQTIFQMRHTPWIRLEQAANITDATDDGSRVVLGRVQLAAGAVTGLTHERRREVGLPAGGIKLWRGETTSPSPNFKAENTVTGEIRARAAGGLEVRVAKAGDQIDFKRDGGSIAKISMGADYIVARRADGKETVVIDSQYGNIVLGTTGMAGDIVCHDANNRMVITLDGDTAAVVVGAAGNEGDILVKDNAGNNSVRIDGNTGTVHTKRVAAIQENILDVDANYVRIHGHDLILDGRSKANNRALVDATNKLIVNYSNDYTNGVDVRGLHLADHIKTGFWEVDENGGWRPSGIEEFFSHDTGLQASEWSFVTFCEIGMQNLGSASYLYWWATYNQSSSNAAGNFVIRWSISVNDQHSNWFPSNRKVFWLAFRK